MAAMDAFAAGFFLIILFTIGLLLLRVRLAAPSLDIGERVFGHWSCIAFAAIIGAYFVSLGVYTHEPATWIIGGVCSLGMIVTDARALKRLHELR